MQTHFESEMPSVKSQNEFMDIKCIANEFFMKLLGTYRLETSMETLIIWHFYRQSEGHRLRHQSGGNLHRQCYHNFGSTPAIVTAITLKKAESWTHKLLRWFTGFRWTVYAFLHLMISSSIYWIVLVSSRDSGFSSRPMMLNRIVC